MAEYIKREKVFDAVFGQFCASSDETEAALNAAIEEIRAIPAADVRPVVTCERCVYHVDCGYHYCNKWRVNCPDDVDFFCAYGEREES